MFAHLGNKLLVQFTELGARQTLRAVVVFGLKVKIVLAILEELARSNVHAELDFASVAGALDGLDAKLRKTNNSSNKQVSCG